MSGPTLRYASPATIWTDALPLGNGRIGAMAFGGVGLDRFQVNDDRAWSGSPATAAGTPLLAPGEGPHVLAETRAALLEGDPSRAEKISSRLQHGHSQSFQPLVDLWWKLDLDVRTSEACPSGYARELDLEEAVARHRTVLGETRMVQESWVSAIHDALVVTRRGESVDAGDPAPLPTTDLALGSRHPTASTTAWASEPGRGRIETVVRMPSHVVPPHEDLPDPVRYDDQAGHAVTAVVTSEVRTDGDLVATASGLRLVGATWVSLALVTEADYTSPLEDPHGDIARLRHGCASRLDQLSVRLTADNVHELREEHVRAHRELFGRVDLTLGDTDTFEDETTDERLQAAADGRLDPGLAALAFQYGRYLLLASSRPGTLPLTLQGIWNDKIRPPWSSNYTTNINVEMNYWPAEVTGLGDCHLPLLDWLHEVSVRGSKVASELYGLRGWTLHHNSDAWGFALPAGEGDADPCWSFWPLGAAWLTRHIWDHYDYSRDLDRLEHDWSVARGAVEFCLDWLVLTPDGSLGTMPSTSPENKFVTPEGARALSWSSTADLVIVADLLARSQDMVRALGDRIEDDPVFSARVAEALAKLPAERVLADGRLAEWSTDLIDAEPEHRHTSHLLGVYPMTRIAPRTEPELADSARRTLDARGPRSTGWALAWRIALRARLHDPAGAQVAIANFLAPMSPDASVEPSMTEPAGVYRNLFCAHPPFQIDGNLGFSAAVAEMLLNSRADDHTTTVEVLPCLVPGWEAGRFSGLRARGGVTVGAQWSGAQVLVEVSAEQARSVVLRSGDDELALDLQPRMSRFALYENGRWVLRR